MQLIICTFYTLQMLPQKKRSVTWPPLNYVN